MYKPRLGNYKKPLLCGARRKTNLWSELRKVGSENRKIIVQIDVVCVCVYVRNVKGPLFHWMYIIMLLASLEKLMLGKLRKPRGQQ